MSDVVSLPPAVEYAALALAAASGALLAVRKGYDVIGITALALATGTGGGVLRDCLLQGGPVALLSNPGYVIVAVASALVVLAMFPLVARLEQRLNGWVQVLDALSLALFAVVGMVKAQAAGLAPAAVALVGVVTAVGGGVLRDVLCREEPLLFRPGQFYALAVVAGCLGYVGLVAAQVTTQANAALVCAAIILVVRLGSVWFGWRTHPIEPRTPSGDR